MGESELRDLHLADLHEQAARQGVPGYRLLGRDELIDEIAKRAGGTKGRERDAGLPRERLEPEPDRDEGEPATGLLELTPHGFGFLRLDGFRAGSKDVYVSASQIRRCELREGDEVSGPARHPRRGERHHALVHVDGVNGFEPVTERAPGFDALTPVVPKRRVSLETDGADALARAVDLLAPLALGQRVLVRAAPRSGRTTLLRAIGRAVVATEGPHLVILLVDERPEEATAWREALPDAELAVATGDLAPAEQLRVARLALERARRLAETGTDAVLLVDSLSRLAVAARDVAEVKRLFGSGRELAEEGAGSLTVVATVVEGADDGGDAERAVITTESSLVTLDPDLAAQGLTPALRPAECRVSGEAELRDAGELEAVRRLRSLLADLEPAEAAHLLRERIEGSSSNAELLGSL